MKKTTKGKSIGVSLLAALMASALLVSAASALASTPANPTDPASGGPANPSYRMEPQRFCYSEVVLEGDSNSDGHADAIGQAYWAHRDFWPPCLGYVTGRADTEADRGADIVPPATDTRVCVRIWLQRRCGMGRWRTQAESDWVSADHECGFPWQTREYDVDVVVRAPMYWGGAYWRTTTMHRVYRDGSTILRSQATPPRWIYIGTRPTDKTPVKP